MQRWDDLFRGDFGTWHVQCDPGSAFASLNRNYSRFSYRVTTSGWRLQIAPRTQRGGPLWIVTADVYSIAGGTELRTRVDLRTGYLVRMVRNALVVAAIGLVLTLLNVTTTVPLPLGEGLNWLLLTLGGGAAVVGSIQVLLMGVVRRSVTRKLTQSIAMMPGATEMLTPGAVPHSL